MTETKDKFVQLHNHSFMSWDGFDPPEVFAKRAAELGQPAIAFTEHGTLGSLPDAQKACDAAGIKLVIGVEMYLCDNSLLAGVTAEDEARLKAALEEKAKQGASAKNYRTRLKAMVGKAKKKLSEARKRRTHITLWAQNQEGLESLYALSQHAWGPGYYYKPRIDLEVLKQHSAGLIVSSGCPSGEFSRRIIAGEFESAVEYLQTLKEAFPDRLYVELLPHYIEEQEHLQEVVAAVAAHLDLPLILTQDAHYPLADDAIAHDARLAIVTNSVLNNPDRFKFSSYEYFLRSREEMIEAFEWTGIDRAVLEQAADNTVALTDRCEARYEPAEMGQYIAAPEVPAQYGGYDEWLVDLVVQGCTERFGKEPGDLDDVYRLRLADELDRLIGMGFSQYLILVWDAVRWAREQGIFIGPGRGSSAGSLVVYLLKITDVDPIRFGLSFDRFTAPGRSDLPDIDTDIEFDRRQEVIQYLRDKYGADRVAQISTNQYLRGKATLRSLGKVYGVPVKDTEEVANLVGAGKDEDDVADETVQKALKSTDTGRRFAAQYPDVAAVAPRVEGQLRTVGIHAAGVVVSSVPLVTIVPLESRGGKDSEGRTMAVAYDKKVVEKVGLVKLDALGLKMLSIFSRACKSSGLDLKDVDLEDQDVIDAFTAGRLWGTFQFDTPSARRLCSGYEFRHFMNLADMTALDRPGPMQSGLADQYIDTAGNPPRSIHPIYDKITAETAGVLIYQEQLIDLTKELAGYTAEEADKFRKKVSHKEGLLSERQKFVAGCQASGMPDIAATELFDMIEEFGAYCFNKCVDIYTEIATLDGVKPAWAVVEGDRIVEYGLDGSVVAGEVVRVYDMETKDRFEVSFEGGSRVICTGEHRFQTPDGPVAVQDMHVGSTRVLRLERVELSDGVGCSLRRGDGDEGGSSPAQEEMHGLHGDEAVGEAGAWGGASGCLREALRGESASVGSLEGMRGVPEQAQGDPLEHDEEDMEEPLRHDSQKRVGDREEDFRSSGDHRGENEEADGMDFDSSGAPGAGRREDEEGQIRRRVEGLGSGENDLGDAGPNRLQEELAGQMREGAARGRLRGRDSDRSGWLASLQADLRAREDGSGPPERLDPDEVGGGEEDCGDPHLAGLLHTLRESASDVEKADRVRLGSPAGWHPVARRLVSVRRLAPGPVVDFEVTGSHLYALANGLVSHNSHSVSYAMVAFQSMWLKLRAPADFYAATMAVHYGDDAMKTRIAAEARHDGVPIRPPEVSISQDRMAVVEVDGQREVYGSLVDIKGIGPKTSTEVAASAPYFSVGDFVRRAGGMNRGRFIRLIGALGFRRMCSTTKVLLENSDRIWNLAKDGYDFDLRWADRCLDYQGDEMIRVTSTHYPLYTTDTGRSLVDVEYARLQALSPRRFATLSMINRDEVGASHVVVARLNKAQMFPDPEGGKSGKIALFSPVDGVELVARIDKDVFGTCSRAATAEGKVVVALMSSMPSRRGPAYSVDGVWLAEDLGNDDGDAVSNFLVHPWETRPRDPGSSIYRARQGKAVTVEGVVVRREFRKDKHEQTYARVGLLGQSGYCRFYVFAKRMGNDTRGLAPGAACICQLEKLGGFGACLGVPEVVYGGQK